MPNTKISALPTASLPLAGTELIPLVQGGQTVRAALGPSVLTASLIGAKSGLAGAVDRTQQQKNSDTVSVLEFGTNTTPGTTDMSAAFTAAFAVADYVIVPERCLIKSRIDATGKWIMILPGAAIVADMSTFTTTYSPSTNVGVGILFSGSDGGGIEGGEIVPNTYMDDRKFIPVRVVSSDRVTIRNVDFHSFSQSEGIVSIDSSDDITVAGCKFRDCTTNSSTVGQITGIMVDDNRVASARSQRPKIIYNEFKNLTVGSTFLAAHGYETDAINTQFCDGAVIIGNTMHLVGEGIDHWGDRAVISQNVISSAYIAAIKLVHGASRNLVAANSAYESGLAGVTIGGSSTATQDTAENVIENNMLVGIDPDGVWGLNDSACIKVDDESGTTYLPRRNIIRNNTLNPGAGGKYNILRANCTGGNNHYPDNDFVVPGSVGYIADNVENEYVSPTVKTSICAYLSASDSIAAGATERFIPTLLKYDTRGEFDIVNGRVFIKFPGVYTFSCQVSAGAPTTADRLLKLIVDVNGTTRLQGNGVTSVNGQVAAINGGIRLQVGDEIQFWGTNNDTAPISFTGASELTFFSLKQE